MKIVFLKPIYIKQIIKGNKERKDNKKWQFQRKDNKKIKNKKINVSVVEESSRSPAKVSNPAIVRKRR